MSKSDTKGLPIAFGLLGDGVVDIGAVEHLGVNRSDADGELYELFRFELLVNAGRHLACVTTWVAIDPESDIDLNPPSPASDDNVAQIDWQDLSGNLLDTLSGLNLPFSDFATGSTLTDSSARYAFWVSLRDGDITV